MPDIAARVEQARQRWNAGDLDGYLTVYDDSIRLHGYGPEPLDKPGVTAFYRMIFAALSPPGGVPELVFHETMVDGDLYACRFTMSGAQSGEFMGVPASGRPYQLPGITMMRFRGERVVERWSSADFQGLMAQLTS